MEKEKEKYPLTLKELLEKRKTMAKFRAQESYRHAKAHRQNKIKSKKYHRLLRKEKTKDQIKEFEKLQETDPVAALEKLNTIEKTRAEERASLRHKSTGQWAQNHVVRAKYDKNVSIYSLNLKKNILFYIFNLLKLENLLKSINHYPKYYNLYLFIIFKYIYLFLESYSFIRTVKKGPRVITKSWIVII